MNSGNNDEDYATKCILEKLLGEEIMYSCHPKENYHINNMLNCFANGNRMYMTEVCNNIDNYINLDNDRIGISLIWCK